ncbi:hypothetical protein QQ045_017915 [Rhodiola kirilowii]
MDSSMNNFISDQLHVAQQSRREKLRVQHCSPSRSGHRVDDYTSGLEVTQTFFNPDLIQVGDGVRNNVNLMYHPAGISTELLSNFSNTTCNNNNRNGAMEKQESIGVNSNNLVSSDIDGSLSHRRENNLENCGVWKSVGNNNCNAESWNTDCVGRYRKNASLGIVSDPSAFETRAKHNSTGYRQSQFQNGEMNFGPNLSYQNALSNEVTTAVLGMQPNCCVRGSNCISWGSYGGDNEHVRIPPYGYQPDGGRLLSNSTWNGEMSSLNSRIDQMVFDSSLQGLSLSLCSNPANSMITGSPYGDSRIPQSIPVPPVTNIGFQDLKQCNTTHIFRTASVGQGNSITELADPSTNYHRQIGPLGPFTGYATILKSSRFLKPAQQLLDEYCGMIGKFPSSSSTRMVSDENIGNVVDLATAVNSIENEVRTTSSDIFGISTSTHQESDEIIEGATTSSQGESRRPDYQLKKAKLLYMLEEVSLKYKQYYQQMQMVVSAFESVAGLATATPYISSALKTISRHFNHLKNAISDQLRHIKSFLGEDFSLSPSGIRNKGELNTKRLKYTDHSFQKHKCGGGSNMGLLEPQQHIWRPQRGLPERAVSVLRAWLFEHFLHPYPTDTDKHMLATQTGLTRSQVSNWFINARVRLWKPMVEEVHMLETKGLTETNRNAVEDDNVSTNMSDAIPLNKVVGNSVANVNLQRSDMGSLPEMGDVIANQQNQEKRSQVEIHNMSGIDEHIMRVPHYQQQPGHGSSGIGSISLTLGLRQSADQMYRLEGSQHQLQQDGIRQHLGGPQYAGYE